MSGMTSVFVPMSSRTAVTMAGARVRRNQPTVIFSVLSAQRVAYGSFRVTCTMLTL